MVRTYKPRPGHRQYKRYDPEIIRRAFEEFSNGTGSMSSIANKYQITKSVLHRRIHKKNHQNMAGNRAFSLEREEHIIKYINACAPWHYNLQCWDLRLLIKFYLDRRPVITKRKFDHNLPGQEFITNFMKRHEDIISQRIIQNLTIKETSSIEAVLSYFHELKMSITGLDPNNIVCYSDVLVNNENEKNKKETDEANTNNIFVMMAATVSGEMLSPYITYKEQECYEIFRRSLSTSKQSRLRLSGKIFSDWFKSVILPFYKSRPGKKCLIGGYFSSRISMDLVKICKKQNIDFVFLPENSSHLTQPLQSLLEQIHTAWSDVLYQKVSDKETEEHFRTIVQNLASDSTEKILEGMKIAGISPINPVEVLKQLPDYNETTVLDVDIEFEKSEIMKNLDTDEVQVKEEVEWSDEYIEDDYDEEIVTMEKNIAMGNNQNPIRKSLKLKGIGKKTKNKITEESEWVNSRILSNLDLKLSPIDFTDDIICEDAVIDFIPENISDANEATLRSSEHSTSTTKTKEVQPNRHQNAIYYDSDAQENDSTPRITVHKRNPSDKEKDVIGLSKNYEDIDKAEGISNVLEMDPLANYQNGSLRTTTGTSQNAAEGTIRSRHCKNGTCNTHTRLLEGILSSVTRQEKWQERTARAMEAQTQALTNLVRLLERRGEGDSRLSYS